MALNVDSLLTNNTPLEARAFHQTDHLGFDTITVVAKLAWRVSPQGEASIAVPGRAIRPEPEHHDPADHRSSPRYPEDRAPEKPGTDVIMLASATPPPGAQVQSVDVSLRVETGKQSLEKAVRVFGARVFMKSAAGVKPGPGQPVVTTPIVYELAEGGQDPEHPDVVDFQNPIGIGKRKHPESLVGQPAYRIEPLGGTRPAGFGAMEANWEARRRHQGTRDAAYQRERYPIKPKDFDPRFYACAHPDLHSDEPLLGDEPVEIIGATPEPAFRFRLPRYRPRFEVTLFGETAELPTHLDTVLIDLHDPKHRIVEQCWRARVRLPKRSEYLSRITITNAIAIDEPVLQRLMKDLGRDH